MTKANNCVLGLHSLSTKTYHGIEWDDDNDAAKPTFECHWANNQSRVFAKIGCSQLLQGHNDGEKMSSISSIDLCEETVEGS